jgi:UDP-2,3-diacylglucosamine pyrophosphatase LpxH
MTHSRWLAKLGAVGYDLLILLNRACNAVSERMGKGKFSFSARIKNSVKKAVKFINDFELTASDLAIEQGYNYVICGHIHQPVIKEVSNSKGSVIYLNSGDWIENLSALEYHNGEWKLYRHLEDAVLMDEEEEEVVFPDLLEDQVLQFISKVTP